MIIKPGSNTNSVFLQQSKQDYPDSDPEVVFNNYLDVFFDIFSHILLKEQTRNNGIPHRIWYPDYLNRNVFGSLISGPALRSPAHFQDEQRVPDPRNFPIMREYLT